MSSLYRPSVLEAFATEVLTSTGLPEERAQVVSRTLVASDLMGHTTHGLQLLWPYAQQAAQGLMTREGEPETITDHGSAVTWDGRRLPGPWLIEKAIDLGIKRLPQHPVWTMAIARSHHIACLAAYLTRVTDQGYMIILASSDPGNRTVAPYGSTTGVYSPDPLAYGIPTGGDPILFDSSASTQANGLVMQRHAQGRMLDDQWLMQADGTLTDDPAAFFDQPPATILPLGGLSLGFKGFGLALLIEALTSGLAGSGRRDHDGAWSASVFLMLIDPSGFGGLRAMTDEMDYFREACQASRVHPDFEAVRLPGQRALEQMRRQLQDGVELHPEAFKTVQRCAAEYAVSMPPTL